MEPLTLKPRLSKRFTLILLFIHCGALLVLIPLTFSIWLKIILATLVLVSAYHTSCLHLLFINHPLYGCIFFYDNKQRCLKIKLKSGQWTILNSCYVHSQWVVFSVQERKDSLIIFADALEPTQFHQLRLYLRHASPCLEKL
jgi:hypothetical protein